MSSRKNIPTWAVFCILFLFFFVTGRITPEVGINNEWDVLACARQFMNRSWLSGDWYLNQSIGYRYFFNLLMGNLFRIFPLATGVFIGRILFLLLLSWACTRLVRVFTINIGVLMLGILYFLPHQSLGAGEWIIFGLESKVFAYPFWIISMTYLVEKRYFPFWLFGGIAVSFHVLVGGYGLLCCGLLYLGERISDRNFSDILLLLRSCWIFLISGFLGIWSILSYIFIRGGGSSELGDLASQIYTWRVGRHVNPLWNSGPLNYSRLLVYMAVIIALLLLYFFYRKFFRDNKLSNLLVICLFSSFFVFIGIGASYFKHVGLMKLYLFRFPDTIIPFFLPMFILQGVYLLVKRRGESFLKGGIDRYITTILMIIVCGILIFQKRAVSVIEDLSRLGGAGVYIDTDEPKERAKLFSWILANTERDSIFLVSPLSFEDFYFRADRARVVSIKHLPQTDPEIVEWFDRLTFCFNGAAPKLEKKSHYKSHKRNKRFSKISRKKLLKGKEKYGYDYYVPFFKRKDLKDWQVFKAGKFYVYKIP